MLVAHMMDLSESGPLELGQIILLMLAGLVFLVTSLSRQKAGMPLLMVFAIMLGLGALREFDSQAADGLGAYLDTLAARWHFMALMVLPLGVVVIRNLHIRMSEHVRAVVPIVPVFIAGMALAWLAGTVEGWQGSSFGERQLLIIEEMLELVAYAITLAAAVWQASRSSRVTHVRSRFSITAGARGLQGR